MIVYITGASGAGKSTILNKISIPGYDLDTIYENNWKKHRTFTTVQKGVKKDIDVLVAKHPNIVFVGLQGKDDLQFVPDVVYVLIRKDYEQFYRQKLVRDLNLLCTHKKNYESVLMKKPFEEFRNHFWSNDMVNMKSFDDFKTYVDKATKMIHADFPKSEILTADNIIKKLKGKALKRRYTRKN